jgi:hypothetical protein
VISSPDGTTGYRITISFCIPFVTRAGFEIDGEQQDAHVFVIDSGPDRHGHSVPSQIGGRANLPAAGFQPALAA